jgi:DNA-directed RNA polymerase subunit RPC12/RpoP
MIHCQNCGQENSAESNFCRSCGLRFTNQPNALENNYEYTPPRPYSWKTDEFQVSKSDARKTEQKSRVQPFGNQMSAANNFAPQHLAYQRPGQLDANYRCPRCGSHYLPIVERKISTAGWIVFSVLLIFTFIFFWVGLLMKEDVRVCPVCRAKVS